MTKGRLLRAAILLLLPVGDAHADDEIRKGRELAERLCATCHMGPGQGEKKSGAEIPSFLAIARRPNQNLDGIMNWLRSVPPMMPNHHLSQDEMFSLSQFILSLGEEPAADDQRR